MGCGEQEGDFHTLLSSVCPHCVWSSDSAHALPLLLLPQSLVDSKCTFADYLFFSFYDTIFPSKVNKLFHTFVTWRLDYCNFLQNLPISYGIITIKKNMFLSYLFSPFVFSTQVRHFPKENICHCHYLAACLNLPTVFACVTRWERSFRSEDLSHSLYMFCLQCHVWYSL